MLEKAGLVNGAVWSDLEGTGYPDLILACESESIRCLTTPRPPA